MACEKPHHLILDRIRFDTGMNAIRIERSIANLLPKAHKSFDEGILADLVRVCARDEAAADPFDDQRIELRQADHGDGPAGR